MWRLYLQTVNQVSLVDLYPLPHIDDLFTSLTGGKILQIGYLKGLPTTGTGRIVSRTHDYQYSKGIVALRTSSIWNIIQPCYF